MASPQSGSGQTAPTLPPYLLSSWRLDPKEECGHKLDGLTTSRLSMELIEIQLSMHEKAQFKRRTKAVPSLSALAIDCAQNTLLTSKDPAQEARTIVESLEPGNIKQMLNYPGLTHPVFRKIYNAAKSDPSLALEQLIDIDQIILRNERYIRSRPENANQDDKYLVHLRDLPDALPASIRSDSGSVLGFVRAQLPKGGLELFKLGSKNTGLRTIHATDHAFTKTFRRITKDILYGLDWNNLVIVGGMVSTTLMHTNPLSDSLPEIIEPDIDLYLYGLGPEEANAKVEHIYETWSRNLPSSVTDRQVVKNAKTINFLADYPNRRVQVVLKLTPSITDILLNCDLDACALAFNGSEVLMLPRFVRALETGSSIFTMDLIWGHHLGHRRASQENRLFKYADRGFGLRILPSYARSLQFELSSNPNTRSNRLRSEHQGTQSEEDARQMEGRNRFPSGREPGLKTLKRMAYLGTDFTHRFVRGVSPLMLFPQLMKAENDGLPLLLNTEELKDFSIKVGLMKRARRESARSRAEGHVQAWLDLQQLDGVNLKDYNFDFRAGLGNFEKLMRHSEAWRLDAIGDIALGKEQLVNPNYDADSYDEMPQYYWNDNFSADSFGVAIESANAGYWNNTKAVVCQRVGMPFTYSGFAHYSTRRLRRQVAGDDLKSVMAKQLTIPVIVPFELEHYIMQILPQRYPDLPDFFTSEPCLILFNRHPATIPNSPIRPLPHTIKNERGNLRWWIISNHTMWAHQHRVIDEIFEILWTLYHWLMRESPTHGHHHNPSTARPKCVRNIGRAFRRRCVLPEVDDEEDLGNDLPSLRETLLFRQWALLSPPQLNWTPEAPEDMHWHELFEGDNVRYPFEDGLFWKGDAEELGFDH